MNLALSLPLCRIININPEKNDDFLSKCTILGEYTQFVEKIREYEKADDEKPIENAIEWCITNGILSDFLKKHKPEVLKAMTIDMTFEKREEIIRRDERAAGKAEGIAEGIAEGMAKGTFSVIQGALMNGKDPEEVAAFLNIPLSDVLRAQEGMKENLCAK